MFSLFSASAEGQKRPLYIVFLESSGHQLTLPTGRMRASSLFFWVATAAVAMAVLPSLGLGAPSSINCQAVWSGPSSDNDILDCLKDSDRIRSHWRNYIYPGFAALILLFTIVGMPVVFLCRCCGCCCCKCCLTTKDIRGSRCCLWGWTVVALLWSACVCVLIIVGVYYSVKTFDDTLSVVVDKPLDYISGTRDQIMNLLTDYSQDPPVAPSIDLSAFDKVDTTIREKIETFRNDSTPYYDAVKITSYVLGSVGVALILLIVPFACCQCSGCCPVLFSVLYWLFAILYSVVAVALLLLMYFVQTGCGEVSLQYRREPGVVQWLLVPWCEKEFNFQSARTEVTAEMTKAAGKACDELLNYCDPSDNFNVAEPKKIFVCGNDLSSSTQCTTIEFVTDVILNTYVKPIMNNALCTNTTGWSYREDCTLAECASRCQNYENPDLQAKTWSQETLNVAKFAQNASSAVSLLTPMMDCNFILDTFMDSVESPTKSGSSNCSMMQASAMMLGTGFFLGSLTFILGVYILHRGSDIWGAKEDK